MDNETRRSNEERTQWRAKCREALSTHIAQELGLEVSAMAVKLMTRPDDQYEWHFSPNVAGLFTKQLSKHSKKAYVSLCDGLGKEFRAVRKAPGPSPTCENCSVLEERIVALQRELDTLSLTHQQTRKGLRDCLGILQRL